MGCRAALATLALAVSSIHVNLLSVLGERKAPDSSTTGTGTAEPLLKPSKFMKFNIKPEALITTTQKQSSMFRELKSRNILAPDATTHASDDLTYPSFGQAAKRRSRFRRIRTFATLPSNLRRVTFKTVETELTLAKPSFQQTEEDLMVLQRQKHKLRSLQASLRDSRRKKQYPRTTYNPHTSFLGTRVRPKIPISMVRGIPRSYYRKYQRMYTRIPNLNRSKRITFKVRPMLSYTFSSEPPTLKPMRRATFRVQVKPTLRMHPNFKWLFIKQLTYKPINRVTFKTYEGSTMKPFLSNTFKSYSSITFLPKMMRYRRITFKSYPRKYAWENMPKKDTDAKTQYHTFMQPKNNQFYRDKWLQRGKITYRPLGTTTAMAVKSMRYNLVDMFD